MADCLGGCGTEVGPGQKCPPCATLAVAEFFERRRARRTPAAADEAGVLYVHSCGYRAPRKGHRKRDVIRECGYCHGELEPAVTVH